MNMNITSLQLIGGAIMQMKIIKKKLFLNQILSVLL